MGQAPDCERYAEPCRAEPGNFCTGGRASRHLAKGGASEDTGDLVQASLTLARPSIPPFFCAVNKLATTLR